MKLHVIKNIRDPWDATHKGRFAVAIQFESFLIILPCTTYFQRTGMVPAGAALLAKDSPAKIGSGFTADDVCISFRDAFRVEKGSGILDNVVIVGILDLEIDKRFKENVSSLILQYLGRVTKKA